jgi:hypothetical protein
MLDEPPSSAHNDRRSQLAAAARRRRSPLARCDCALSVLDSIFELPESLMVAPGRQSVHCHDRLLADTPDWREFDDRLPGEELDSDCDSSGESVWQGRSRTAVAVAELCDFFCLPLTPPPLSPCNRGIHGRMGRGEPRDSDGGAQQISSGQVLEVLSAHRRAVVPARLLPYRSARQPIAAPNHGSRVARTWLAVWSLIAATFLGLAAWRALVPRERSDIASATSVRGLAANRWTSHDLAVERDGDSITAAAGLAAH